MSTQCRYLSHLYIAFSQMAFPLPLFWLQSSAAINSEPYQRLLPSFCTPPCEVSIIFNQNMSRHSDIEQVIDLQLLLLCTGLCQIQVLLVDQRMTRRLSKEMIAALGLLQVLTKPIDIPFLLALKKQKSVVTVQNLQSIKTLLTLKHFFLKLAFHCQQRLPQTWKHPMYILAHMTSQSYEIKPCPSDQPKLWQGK